jgi:hypothetical protein
MTPLQKGISIRQKPKTLIKSRYVQTKYQTPTARNNYSRQ